MSKTVVVIPGEDAATEAMEASVALLDRMALGIDWVFPKVGLPAKAEGLSLFPAEARAAIDAADASYFGATSGPSSAALLYLRWGKETFANVRPSRWTPGLRSPLQMPEGIDLVIMRENLEDSYLGLEGDLADLAPLGLVSRLSRRAPQDLGDGMYALKAITRAGSEKVARAASTWRVDARRLAILAACAPGHERVPSLGRVRFAGDDSAGVGAPHGFRRLRRKVVKSRLEKCNLYGPIGR